MRAMFSQPVYRVFLNLFVSVGLFAMLCIAGGQVYAAGLQRLHAEYKISFGGFDLGAFRFWSEMSSKRYSILGKGKLSVMSGVFFKWEAVTKSSGKLTPIGPEPKKYMFSYKSSEKKERLQLSFRENAVASITAKPPYRFTVDQVPVSRNDLVGVFDPMSAIIHLTSLTSKKITSDMSSGQIACAVSLSVFDGKERYDLVFSHKKTVRMEKTKKNGYSGPAHICRVKYIPISGHKSGNEGTTFMARSNDIEVWMILMKKVDLYLPYHIVVPTPVGHATATSKVFQVEKAGDLVAFVN